MICYCIAGSALQSAAESWPLVVTGHSMGGNAPHHSVLSDLLCISVWLAKCDHWMFCVSQTPVSVLAVVLFWLVLGGL